MVRFGSKVVYPTDPEDIWGNVHLVGNAELAARLGSINMFDRRGDTVWMDDFEAATLRWFTLTDGGGAAVALTVSYVRNGAQSVKLTAGSGDNKYAIIGRTLSLPVMARLGFEASFTVHADLKRIAFSVDVYTGAHRHYIEIIYNIVDKTLTYLGTDGNPHSFVTDLELYKSARMFHTLKVVADYSTGKYIRCILDDQTYDISSYSYYSLVSPAELARCDLGIGATNSKAGNPSIYIDNVIFTQNEPRRKQ